MNAEALKRAAARRAIDYLTPGAVVGVGTGSTVAHFIAALGERRSEFPQAVSSSERSTALLRDLGIEVVELNALIARGERLDTYVDGADEVDPRGCMIKGGGAALTREKIVAALASRFVLIADASKNVDVLGAFPLPIEVIPMAEAAITRRFAAGVCGTAGEARLRTNPDGTPFVTDNGQHILDVHGLRIADPPALESAVNDWPGVVTVGVFAHIKASVCLLGTPEGVRTITY